ncbi:hypothetical protein GCM10022197_11350 [Microlunatus spumicola]|uniref:FHA domain-containing protein n=1 Tax=Microlunatus spumicola TaxID=81499 RepID=A0ABP6WZ12_9ACTN
MQPPPTAGGPAAATYGGAGGTLLRTGGWAVLLDVDPGHPLVTRCWERLPTTADVDALLETVLAEGPEALPAFALVREAGVRRLVARGAVRLLVDGTEVQPDRPAAAWLDLPLGGASTLGAALADGSAEPHLPLRDGVAAAGAFHLVLVDTRPAESEVHRADDTQSFVGTTTLAGSGTSARPTGTVTRARDAATTTVRVRRQAPTPVAGAPGAVDAPRVLAAVCPAGHLTPAWSGLCRVCRRPVPPQEAFETARPALGRLVLPQGVTLLLDRGAVLGRAPHVPADWVGAQPHLVALPDPDQDVSAQHVAVVLDLWNVLVCDLGSTNGTAVVDHAGRVTPLRAYEPTPLGPGGAIVLADVVTLPFEVQP